MPGSGSAFAGPLPPFIANEPDGQWRAMPARAGQEELIHET